MPPPTPDKTSATLLDRLRGRSTDPADWQEFVRRYQPRIHAQCLAFGLQEADAEDVTQNVLLRLVAKLPEFRYDPAQCFRAWLRTVTRHVLSDFLAQRRGEQGSGDSAVVRLLDRVEAREGLARQVEAEFDQELLGEALRRVRRRVPAAQWDAFRLTTLEGRPGAEAAAQLQMSVGTVYTAKSNVKKLVGAEVRALDEQTGQA